MTESDLYQLVGEAYCHGVVSGMEKSSSANQLRGARALAKSILSNKALAESAKGQGALALLDVGNELSAGAKLNNIVNLLKNKVGASQEKAISRVANAIAGKGNATGYTPADISNKLKPLVAPNGNSSILEAIITAERNAPELKKAILGRPIA